jgi:pimeloyl-ACP methyl ester carboxylesterase
LKHGHGLTMTALPLLVVAVFALASAGILYQTAGLARDARRFPPPGTLLDAGGYRLHTVCRGYGAPTVVLESAIAGSSLSWSRVQPHVARFTSVCAYDRAGLGWSDASTVPTTLARVIDDLHAVIAKTESAVPCVMVGHSFGVFLTLAYAALYPRQVSGLVLLDPPSEWVPMDSRQAYLIRGAIALSRVGGILARVGVVRACLTLLTGSLPAAPRHFVKVFGPTTARTLERLVGEVRKLPPETHPLVQAVWCHPKCFRALADQLRVFHEATGSAARFPPPRDVPLVVISSGDQPPNVLAAHRALVQTSQYGHHIVASKSGHWVQFDEPELVVEAIHEVVEASRRKDMSVTPGH